MLGKLMGLLLLAAAVVVLVPPVREKARPHLQFAFDPFYEWSTRNRVAEIRDRVKELDQLGRPIPTPREFATFLDRSDFRENASVDPWGSPFYLQVTRAGFRVGSPGKDRVRNTTDDILSAEEKLTNQPAKRR